MGPLTAPSAAAFTSPAFTSPAIATPVTAPGLTPQGAGAESGSFQDLFSSSLRNVEAQGAQSKQAVQQFLSGEADDIHKVAIASQKAELSAQLFIQIRNKMISAYQEIMKMQM